MSYARARLLLGISNVGFWVTISLFFLLTDLHQTFFPFESADLLIQVKAVFITLLIYICLSFPFDVLGGYYLPLKFKKSTQTFAEYIPNLIRGAVIHATVLLFFATSWLYLAKTLNPIIVFLFLATSSLLLLFFQSYIARIVSANVRVSENIKVFKNINRLSPKLKVILENRYKLLKNSGLKNRGRLLAMAWTLIGALVCILPSNSSFNSAYGLVTFIMYYTIWSFFGLLLLPTPSRKAVYWLDKQQLSNGVDPNDLERLIKAQELLQDGELSRSKKVETIFHPIPSLENRVSRFRNENTNKDLAKWVGWQMARLTLFYSWACLNPLSRAVHCNIGCPEKWVYLPSD